MSKTIVMIGNTSWGMLRFRGDLAKQFVSEGHRVIIIAPVDTYSNEFSKMNVEFINLFVDRKGTNPLTDFFYIIKLTRVLLDLKPNIALCYTIKPILYGIVASKLSGVPTRIAITTGLGNVFSSEGWFNKFVKFLYKITLKFASEVWFLNHDDAEIFLKNYLVDTKKVFILPGEGVNTEEFKPLRNFREERFTVICRMLWDKGVGIFVEAARALKKTHPNVQFRLVGPVDLGNPTGIPIEQLQEWSNEGLVEYYGATDDIRSILGETTCLVHPTYYKEGVPRVLMEASSMEIPCITTNIPGCRDVIEDGLNGYLIPEKDFHSLFLSMTRFVGLETFERESLGEAGRKRVLEKFSSDKIIKIYFSRLRL